ncbi:tetratricopeptide repeat protein [Cupriavidus basilensis]|uniref:Tetratricopeptide repeat protein n=1 Tax=Cupriavidus basilensis TaxID=68895 RepID=A0ABT6AR94_9BURK|nr:tetratricopeptide repeat protein [Cupriavidus basilensis]MDF3834913.1 tetratricopeptide repeat protein [Cupriavidus basilensis]
MNSNVTRRVLTLGLATISLASGSAWAHEADDLYAAMEGGKCEPAATTLQARAKSGVAMAQRRLGMAYFNGVCVKANEKAGAAWMRKAAEQGDMDARNEVGSLYLEGNGVSKDPKEAMRWFRLAAEQGDAHAQYSLAQMYYFAEGVPKDDREAVKWVRKAAVQGHAGAQASLGAALIHGEGMVLRDRREGAEWLRKAAMQGNTTGQNNLAGAYENGWGVPRNMVLAYAWVLLSTSEAKPGSEGMTLRVEMGNLLNGKQRAESERLARGWKVGQDLTTAMK